MSEAGKTPAAPPTPSGTPQISLGDFQKIALRVGVVISAENHPNADRLLVLKVDVGEDAPRQLVAGIRGAYQASDLIGKQVVVVANLKPATLRGVESQGMVLAASDGSSIVLLNLDRSIGAGSVVK